MDSIFDSYRLSNEWQRRFDIIKDRAEHADKGDTFFMQVSSHPIVSLFLVTGDIIDPNSRKKNIHLHLSHQDETYPKVLTSQKQMDTMGWNKYNALCGIEESNQHERKIYDIKMKIVCSGIDESIKCNHGVKCFEDGNVDNLEATNIFYLHICDILNLMVNKQDDTSNEIVVETKLLKSIPDGLVNDFEVRFLNRNYRDFLLKHIDFIYYCYAYVGNHSFIPIRLKVNKDSTIFKDSSFFMNNEHFLKHQFGKLQEINQNGCGIVSQIAYRSI